MDTLHFERRSVHSRQVSRLFGDREDRKFDDLNLSEVEVFMLRGRRLQAQLIGNTLRQAFSTLRRLLRAPMTIPARPSGGPTATRRSGT